MFYRKLGRHEQRFGKIATTTVLEKMKICYDQDCNDIGVVIAAKWRRYLFYLQQYFFEVFGTGNYIFKTVHGSFFLQ